MSKNGNGAGLKLSTRQPPKFLEWDSAAPSFV